MADVTTSFAAKDESFAATVDKLNGRLQGFSKDTESFTQKVGNMGQKFAELVGPIAAVGAAFMGVKSVVNAFREAIDMGGKLNDLSARTGETAGNLAILQRAFENAGASGDSVGSMLNRLQRFMVEAADGGKMQLEALQKLGVSYEKLLALTPTEQMKLLAEKLNAIENPAIRSAVAMDVFGKSGGELMPLLRAMTVELDTARAQLGSYPDVIDRSNVALDAIGDNFGAIAAKGREFATGLLSNVAPALAEITAKIAEIDAAGFGMMLADYFDKMIRAASEAFKLGSAIDSVKLAIEAMTSGNFGEGLSLMWVTMKVTALNAVNEIASNFTAAFMTVRDFIATMFDSQGALAHLMNTMFSTAANYMKEQLYGALASFSEAIGRMGMAEAFRIEAETARNVIEMNMKGLGAQFELVGEQAGAAGRAMPENFEKNKASLQPIFDLTPVLQEQQQLHASIEEKLALEKTSTEAINAAGAGYAASLGIANAALESGGPFSATLSLNLGGAAMAAERIAPALALASVSSDKINLDLQTSSTHLEEVPEWLKMGAFHTGNMGIHGADLASQTALAAGNVEKAKMDAKITAEVLTGMSDRMNAAVEGTSAMLDAMRESFHFGRETAEETYKRLNDGSRSILEAGKEAADYQSRQVKADSELRKLENKVLLAENKRDREYEKAARQEARKQEKAAHNTRMRADEKFSKTLETLSPEIKAATEESARLLKESGGEAGSMLKDGASAAGDDFGSGARDAGDTISRSADALKDAASGLGDALALESTLLACKELLSTISENLPQNSLS